MCIVRNWFGNVWSVLRGQHGSGETVQPPPTSNSGYLSHMDAPPDNDCCSVCHDSFTLPCQANCAHWFCGKQSFLYTWMFSNLCGGKSKHDVSWLHTPGDLHDNFYAWQGSAYWEFGNTAQCCSHVNALYAGVPSHCSSLVRSQIHSSRSLRWWASCRTLPSTTEFLEEGLSASCRQSLFFLFSAPLFFVCATEVELPQVSLSCWRE